MKTIGPRYAILLLAIASFACQNGSESERILARTVASQGPSLLEESLVTFKFRDTVFSMKRNNGRFQYERSFADTTGARIHDVLDNSAVARSVDGRPFELDSAKARSVTVDVNSVVYFASLPYPLADPGVRSRQLGSETIEGQEYLKVEVTFTPDKGGLDYDDRFIYWIHPESFDIRYMSYFYHTDGGGSRFRKAVNIRRVEGIQFADYLNYASEPDTVRKSVDRFAEYFTNGTVKLVSEINMDSVVVSFEKDDVRF